MKCACDWREGARCGERARTRRGRTRVALERATERQSRTAARTTSARAARCTATRVARTAHRLANTCGEKKDTQRARVSTGGAEGEEADDAGRLRRAARVVVWWLAVIRHSSLL